MGTYSAPVYNSTSCTRPSPLNKKERASTREDFGEGASEGIREREYRAVAGI